MLLTQICAEIDCSEVKDSALLHAIASQTSKCVFFKFFVCSFFLVEIVSLEHL